LEKIKKRFQKKYISKNEKKLQKVDHQDKNTTKRGSK